MVLVSKILNRRESYHETFWGDRIILKNVMLISDPIVTQINSDGFVYEIKLIGRTESDSIIHSEKITNTTLLDIDGKTFYPCEVHPFLRSFIDKLNGCDFLMNDETLKLIINIQDFTDNDLWEQTMFYKYIMYKLKPMIDAWKKEMKL